MATRQQEVTEPVEMVYSINFGELYEQICRALPMPESLVEKMIAFHLGQMALNVDDMSEMSAFMYHRFKRFAESLPGFKNLNSFDQEFLVSNNSSLYFQFYLARYMNSGSATEQVQAFLGCNLPDDLSTCQHFLTMSFVYFASALRLFSSKLDAELFQGLLKKFKYISAFADYSKIGALAACMVFYTTPDTSLEIDSCDLVKKLYEACLNSVSECFERPSFWATTDNIKKTLKELDYSAHYYGRNVKNKHSFGEEFESLYPLALTTMPDLMSAKEAEEFWMNRKLVKCSKLILKINVGDDYVNEVILQHLLQSHSPLSDNFFSKAFQTFMSKGQLLYDSHHEYTDLKHSREPEVNGVVSQLNTNLFNASLFMFCVMLYDMTNVKISVGLQRLMGSSDQVYWKENFDAIVSDDSDDIRMENPTEISCIASAEATFQSLKSFVAGLASGVGVLSADLVLLIQLAILWKVPPSDVPYRSANNPGLRTVEKAQSISKRYIHFLKERLPSGCAEKLLDSLP